FSSMRSLCSISARACAISSFCGRKTNQYDESGIASSTNRKMSSRNPSRISVAPLLEGIDGRVNTPEAGRIGIVNGAGEARIGDGLDAPGVGAADDVRLDAELVQLAILDDRPLGEDQLDVGQQRALLQGRAV